MAITSVLDDAVKALPDGWKQKAQSIPNTLMKQGVKKEEMEFAKIGIYEQIAKDPLKQLSKEDLLKGLETRADAPHVETKTFPEDRVKWGSITIAGRETPNYEERVYKFGLNRGEDFTSPHFPTKDYSAHSRVEPVVVNGKMTASIIEQQSDLLAAKRTFDRTRVEVKPLSEEEHNRLFSLLEQGRTYLPEQRRYGPLDASADAELRAAGWDGDSDPENWLAELVVAGAKPAADINSPYAKNMHTKLLERNIDMNIANGAEYTSIPIKGDLESLHRDPTHVQPMYEGAIPQAAAKIAKKAGFTVTRETTKPGLSKTFETDAAALKKNFAELQVAERELDTMIDAGDDTLASKLEQTIKDIRGANADILARIGIALDDEENVQHALSMGEDIARYTKAGQTPPTEYLVIHHPKGSKFDAKLYDVGGTVATVTGLYTALDQGVSDEQATNYLVTQEGYSPEEAASSLEQVKAAKAAGVSKEQLAQFMQQQEVVDVELTDTAHTPVDPKTIYRPVSVDQAAQMTHAKSSTAPAKPGDLYKGSTPAQAVENIRRSDDAKSFVASQGVLNPSMHTLLDATKSFAFGGSSKQFVKQEEAFQRERIRDLAKKKHGWDMMYDSSQGGWLVMVDGQWREAEPGFLKELGKASGELAGAVTGGVGAYKATEKVLGKVSKTVPYADKLPLIAGAIGTIVGAVVGNETDYLIEAMKTHTELDAKVQLHRMTDAAQLALLGEALGPLVMKTPSAVKSVVSSINNIPSRIKTAISSEAKIDQALADTMFLNTAEADDLVRMMSRFSNVPGATPTQQRVSASILTQPSGESIVRDLGRLNQLASRSVAKTIDTRAQDLLGTAAKLTDENIERVLSQDLANYVDDTKKFYSDVKLEAAKAPLASQWQFNIDKVAVAPILNTFKENIANNVSDIGMRAKLMSRIQKIEATTHTRDFNDLLELRQIVNDFKYNSSITKAQDFDAVNSVIKNIDSAIESGAREVMPEADRWLDDFAKAKFQYAQMKGVEDNVMYKALTKPGINYDSTVKTLTKYITAEDSTFTDVVAKLPKYTQAKVEGSVLRALSEKYTAGPVGGQRATHFPQLAQALEGISFTSKEARKFKLAVGELAEVFRNDVPLSKVTGSISPPGDVATIATSITGVAKRAIVAKIWNYAIRGAETGTDKMIRMAADVLDKPLNTTKMKELMNELENQVDISEEARELMTKAALEQAQKGEIGMPKVLLYGEGKTLSMKGSGEPTKVARHRIATIEESMQIAEAEGIARSDTKLLDAAMHARGYKAVQYGADKVRLLQ